MGIKNFIKKSISFVSAAAMALTMVAMPVGSSASYAAETGSTTTDPNPNLILDKSAKLQSDGTYTITLEAYAKGRVETTPAVIKPCDIVLVLDQSGSMNYSFSGSKSRQKALQDAATKFVENVSKNAREKKVDHKISIVSFATKSSIAAKNVSLYNETNPNQNTTGEQTLKNAINGLNANGSTRVDLGMENANKLIQKDSTRNKVVVVFTDGYPTQGTERFTISVADSAIKYAKNLKTKNAKVYTIGIFNGADVNQVSGTTSDEVGQYWAIGRGDTSDGKNAAANRFLNYMSSNFSDTSSLGLKTAEHKINYRDTNCYEITTKFNRTNDKYYMTASNQTELSNIFEKISDEVSEGKTDVILDETAVAKDIMSENFNLPNDVTNNVKVYTEDYKGKDTSNEPIWENRQPLTDADVSYDTTEKSISVSGFSYKDNYIVDGKGNVATSGKKLIIVITDVTAKNAGMNMYTNNSNSAIYDGQDGKVKEFPMPQESIDSTSYVLDYGKTVTTAASDYGVSAVTIANADEPSPYNPKDSENRTNVNLTGEYGKFAINDDGDLDYTPGKINWDGIDTGYVFGKQSNSEDYKWEEVNFMPANSVYYEDDFASTATVEEGDTGTKIIYNEGKWTIDGKAQDPEKQSSDNKVQHGWDDSYKNDTNYSNGTAHKGTTGATATFKFTGTGVDIYSRTDLTTGKVLATLTKDGETAASKLMIVDNKSASGTYYQVPTLFFEGLDYGTYEVKIQVLNPIQDGETTRGTYYLDGIRVYNPLGVTKSEKVTNAYNVAGESNAIFTSVRKMLLDAKTFDGDTVTGGAVFIDQLDSKDDESSGEAKTATIGTYDKLGPKNEVYLDAGQAIAFKIKTSYTGKVFIGAKSLNGQQVSMKVTDITTEGGAKSVTLSHTSDMYYQINPTTEKYVVIQNTNNTKGAILAITKLRLTGVPTATTQSSIDFESSPALMSYVNEFATLDSAKTDDRGMAIEKDKPNVDIENPDNSKDDNNQESKPNQSNSNSFWSNIVTNLRKWFK